MAFIYSILPEYTHSLEKYIDSSYFGEYCSLQGYTDAIDITIFDLLRSSIREILTFNDIYTINENYLPYFSVLLGYKWNDYIDSNIQRSIVANILQLYKRKGTIFSFHFNLYNIDQNVEISEPYKDLFVLNRSKLSSNKHLPSRDYYSYGIIAIKINTSIPEIYEIIENVRPAGWRFILEINRKCYTDLNYKPKEKIRMTGIPSFYNIENIEDGQQYQIANSIHYTKEPTVILTMVCQSITTLCQMPLKWLLHSILIPAANVGYNTFLRYGQSHLETRPHYYNTMKLQLQGFLGLIFTREALIKYNYDEVNTYVKNKLVNDNTSIFEYNDLDLHSELFTNSLQYSKILIDNLVKVLYNKKATMAGKQFSFTLDSLVMRNSIKNLKLYTISSFEHIFTEEVKEHLIENSMKGYDLNRFSVQHFSRRLS